MKKVIVSDTTSLIILEKLDQLELLGLLFKNVLIPSCVFDEWLEGLTSHVNLLESYPFFRVVEVKSSPRLDGLLMLLDEGEAHAIEFALVNKLPLIIDENKGRGVATQLNVPIIGFAGLLVQLVRVDQLGKGSANRLLSQALRLGFRMSSSLVKQIRQELDRI